MRASKGLEKRLNGLSYVEMQFLWDFCPATDPLFQGESKIRFAEIMLEKRHLYVGQTYSPDECIRIRKGLTTIGV